MKNSTIKNYIFYCLGILVILLIWIGASYLINNDLVIPKVSDVLKALGQLLTSKKTYEAIFNTIYRIILALIIGFLIALILGTLSYFSKGFKAFITPFIALSRMMPVATIIIILLMIIGNKRSPYIITLLVIVPIIYENILVGLESIPKGITEEVKMLSGVNITVINKIYFPMIYPYMLSGIVSSFGLGLKVMVMAEFISQTARTIGYELNQEKVFLEIDKVFAWTLILIIFMLLVEVGLKLLQKQITKIEGSY